MAWPKPLQTLCPAYLLRSLDRALMMDYIAINNLVGIDISIEETETDEAEESCP